MMKMSERKNSENRYESSFENVLYESPMKIEEELEEEEADLPPCRDLIRELQPDIKKSPVSDCFINHRKYYIPDWRVMLASSCLESLSVKFNFLYFFRL
jgi:hypothetical protein